MDTLKKVAVNLKNLAEVGQRGQKCSQKKVELHKPRSKGVDKIEIPEIDNQCYQKTKERSLGEVLAAGMETC